MNTELSNTLIDVIKSTKEGVVGISAFIQQQAPDLAKQIITWAIYSSIVWMVFEIILAVYCSLLLNKLIKFGRIDQWKEGVAFAILIVGIVLLVDSLCFLNTFSTLLKASLGPKLYLIDYIKGLTIHQRG